jgi:penicillin-binding protein 1A
MGEHEAGATAAAPIFRDFMAEALKDKPPTPFRVPSGIRLVRVNAATGRPAQSGESGIIYEAFKPGTVPTGGEIEVLDNGLVPEAADSPTSPMLPSADSELGAPVAEVQEKPKKPPPQPEAGGLY